jgi:hypothetical protein
MEVHADSLQGHIVAVAKLDRSDKTLMMKSSAFPRLQRVVASRKADQAAVDEE